MNKLLEEIKNSFKLFDRKEGWDGEGALPMNNEIYCKALEVLLTIQNSFAEFNFEYINIALCPDASIDLYFTHSNKYELLINVTKNEIEWYGHDGNMKNETRGKIYYPFSSLDLLQWINTNWK